MQIDLSRLNMVDLISYASVVRTLDEISRPNSQEALATLVSRFPEFANNGPKVVKPHD